MFRSLPIIITFLIILNSCDNEDLMNENINAKIIRNDSNKTQLVLLGTGTPNATPDREGSGLAIIVNGQPYLVDCGVGIVRRSSAAFQKGVNALKVTNLNKVFVTHLHSDHTMGLPDLLLTPWVLGREKPLEIWGPKGIKSMVSNIYKAYKADIDTRLSGLQPSNTTGIKTEVSEYNEGLIYQDDNIDVYAYKVEHGDWDEAYAFQFVTPDKVITVSGDCKPCEGIYEASLGCDILVHEVYSYVGYLTKSPEWQKYHKASHTSTVELSELANKIKPDILVLYHILNWGASPKNLVKEVKQDYDGKVICGEDLLVIE